MELQISHNQDGQFVAADAVQRGHDIVRGSDGAYYVLRDGSTLASVERRTIGNDSFDEAMNDLFAPYAWPGGYAIAWYNDGDILCPQCARQEYEADEDTRAAFRAGEWHCDITNSDDTYRGVQCDNCHDWIVAPACIVCGNDLTDERACNVWYEPNGDRQVCAKCMTSALDAGKECVNAPAWQARPQLDGSIELQYRHSLEGFFQQ